MIKITRPEVDVGIVPSNPDATCAFYRDVLGFAELPSAKFNQVTQHRFGLGRHLLKVNRLPTPPAPQTGGMERAVGIRQLTFLLDDLDPVLARLDAAGRAHASVSAPQAGGQRVVRTTDSEGNALELIGLETPGGEGLTARVQIGFAVSDLDRSRKFFSEVLGLPERAQMKIGADTDVRYSFVWGGTTLQIWKAPAGAPRETGNPFGRAGLRYLTAMVEDIEAAQAELIRKDVPIVQPLNELPGGVAKVVCFADPDGNWLEFAQRRQ